MDLHVKVVLSIIPTLVYFLSVGYYYEPIEFEMYNKRNKQYVVQRVSELLGSSIVANILVADFFSSEFNVSLLMLINGIIWIDTAQYFMHRLYHSIPYLYRNFHKTHHEFIYPETYAALYNSRVEAATTSSIILIGFLLFQFSFLEYIIVTSMAFLATVRDHRCNGEHHYIHHAINKNTNFQQPFFTYWDYVFDTIYKR